MLTLATPFVDDQIGRFVADTAISDADQGVRASTRFIVLHHAGATYPAGGALAAIFRYHAAKWPRYGRIAYHDVIQLEADGQTLGAYQVNPPELVGAGVFGRNSDTFHICAAWSFPAIPDDGWIEALAQRAAAAARRYPAAQIVGHTDIALPGHGTVCPGSRWATWKPRVLARVQQLLLPAVRRYRVRGLPIYERQDLAGPLAGQLLLNAIVEIDAAYPNGAGHLADGRGFVDLDGLEAV